MLVCVSDCVFACLLNCAFAFFSFACLRVRSRTYLPVCLLAHVFVLLRAWLRANLHGCAYMFDCSCFCVCGRLRA